MESITAARTLTPAAPGSTTGIRSGGDGRAAPRISLISVTHEGVLVERGEGSNLLAEDGSAIAWQSLVGPIAEAAGFAGDEPTAAAALPAGEGTGGGEIELQSFSRIPVLSARPGSATDVLHRGVRDLAQTAQDSSAPGTPSLAPVGPATVSTAGPDTESATPAGQGIAVGEPAVNASASTRDGGRVRQSEAVRRGALIQPREAVAGPRMSRWQLFTGAASGHPGRIFLGNALLAGSAAFPGYRTAAVMNQRGAASARLGVPGEVRAFRATGGLLNALAVGAVGVKIAVAAGTMAAFFPMGTALVGAIGLIALGRGVWQAVRAYQAVQVIRQLDADTPHRGQVTSDRASRLAWAAPVHVVEAAVPGFGLLSAGYNFLRELF